ncbi:isoaspartyl peptidase/L-asparaginase 3, partial [Tolypocladium capitatum]
AVEAGCAACERNRCDGTVGYGGSPDEACETTLDALIMDGSTMKAGAVAALRRVRDAVAVARRVLEHTAHTMLAGDLATEFAVQNGFAAENLTTEASAAQCRAWRAAGCQPNYRLDASSSSSCGPYDRSLSRPGRQLVMGGPSSSQQPPQASHDTISLVALHPSGRHAAGTSTNGAAHKIPGRVGDGPIAGSGAYVDSDVGACGATGDGDVMMRFLPCYQAVESMRRGMAPADAAEDAVRRMLAKYPRLQAGLVAVDREGRHGGAASGWTFTYAFRGGDMAEAEEVTVEPLNESSDTT